MSANTVDIYQTGYGPQIGKIQITPPPNTLLSKLTSKFSTSGVETIIILDVSGSMSSFVTNIVGLFLPTALKNLGYSNEKITLITFSDSSKVYSCTASELKDLGVRSSGSTNMTPSIRDLEKVITGSKNKKFRILTISDGELGDQDLTVKTATELAKKIAGSNTIKSSAIRLFTSSSQPDTRGLASILQLNTIGNTKLIDYKCAYGSGGNTGFVDLFVGSLTDDLGSNVKLTSTSPIFMVNPWGTAQTEINLAEGSNTFWLNTDKINNQGNTDNETVIKLNSNGTISDVVLQQQTQLDFGNFETVLKEKIAEYVGRLKLLKVIDMADSKDEIAKTLDYFNNLEKVFALNDKTDVDLSKDTSISSRLKFFKKFAFRQSKSIVQELSAIANQDKVSQLNAAQQADYLRSATTSSNTINLAKRGLKQGFDFDVKAIQEVKTMKAHLNEIADIDDSNHAVSFYSQDTTLGGIRALCSLDDEDGSLDHLGALEILQILNIVGVPCDAIVGDFPDPKTYHISDLMLGTYVSMSDIMIGKQHGNVLHHPFNKKKIINTIPFYDDDRVQQFLMKYAPNLLEYTASLGMRNMVINVPNTYNYTIVDGVWWMVRELQDRPTEANAMLFVKLVNTYKTSVGNLFGYVPDLLKPLDKADKDNNLSIYIGNNGVTNMIGPLIAIQGDQAKMAMVPDILRALYTFEFYQVLRKYYRTDSDGYIKRKQMLDDLLGVDFTKYASSLPPMFESQKVPDHHGEYHLNQQIYDEVTKRAYWVDYICQMPKMFGYALANDISSLMKVNSDTHEGLTSGFKGTHEKELNIGFDLKKFKLCCIAQGLMYDTLASRYDDKTDKMKIEDAGDEKRMDAFLSDYIKRQYHSNYQSELSKQNKQEFEILTGELVSQMVNANDVKEFIKLLGNGLTRNHVSVVISDMFKSGFDELKTKLFDLNVACPDRDKKLRVLVMGCDKAGNVIYNKGNTIRMPIPSLEKLFEQVGMSHVFNEMRGEYIAKSMHLYRGSDAPNRHTHCNSKPSYYAYGHLNLKSYFDVISKEEQDAYCLVHTHCCGVWDGKPYRWA